MPHKQPFHELTHPLCSSGVYTGGDGLHIWEHGLFSTWFSCCVVLFTAWKAKFSLAAWEYGANVRNETGPVFTYKHLILGVLKHSLPKTFIRLKLYMEYKIKRFTNKHVLLCRVRILIYEFFNKSLKCISPYMFTRSGGSGPSFAFCIFFSSK